MRKQVLFAAAVAVAAGVGATQAAAGCWDCDCGYAGYAYYAPRVYSYYQSSYFVPTDYYDYYGYYYRPRYYGYGDRIYRPSYAAGAANFSAFYYRSRGGVGGGYWTNAYGRSRHYFR